MGLNAELMGDQGPSSFEQVVDKELLEQVRQGDDWAYVRLWQRVEGSVMAAARQLGSDSPEDIVSEAQVRVLAAIRAGGGPTDNFRAYMIRTVMNLIHAKPVYRRDDAMPDEDTMPIVAGNDVEETALIGLERIRIATTFAGMPPREAAMLKATVMDGLPLCMAAELAGVSQGAAKMVALRARRNFQRLWYQSHVATRNGADAECTWVLARVGAYLAKSLTKQQQQKVEDHLADCRNCSVVVNEAQEGSHMWGESLGGATGMVSGAFAVAAWERA